MKKEDKSKKGRIFAIGEQIILGTLLGDGYFLKLADRGKNYKLSFTHCEEQKKYALWKANKIKMPYFVYERERYDKRTDKIYKSIDIQFKSDSIFKKYHEILYVEGRKVVTLPALIQITPLAIAIWYCDDGNLYQNKDTNLLTLSIESFNNKEIIIDFFKRSFDINFKLCKNGAIRLTSKCEIKKFINLVKDYIPTSMLYKIDFKDYKIYKGRNYEK